MAYIKNSVIILLVTVFLGITFTYPALATTKLTAEQSKAITQNCSDIKQSLLKLQHADSRTRTYLGSAYEAIAGKFLTPLNLRLVKNGLPSTELFRIQNEFTAAQTDFRNGYVDYMRELDTLVASDCSANPQGFYDQLEIVRTRREHLRKTTQRLNALTKEQYVAVTELKTSL